MVKKNSNEDKTNTKSAQAGVESKSKSQETSTENTAKKPSARSSTKTANSSSKPNATTTSKTRTTTASKKKSTPATKARTKAAGNKKTTAATSSTTPKAKAAQSAKPEVSQTGNINTVSAKTSNATKAITEQVVKPNVPPIGKTSQDIITSSKPEETINKAPGKSRQEKSVTEQPVYQEPETPMILNPPIVEEADSINPPIPEETNAPEENAEQSQEQAVHHFEQPGPQYPSMYVVQITPEMAPLAKVGGLADVVTGLSRELEIRGNSVEIILPKYDNMRYDMIWGLCIAYDDLWVPWYGEQIHCTVWFGFVHERKCFFIEPHSEDNFFNRGSVYGFDDDILRFAFFSRAAIEFLWKAGKHPDIIHCHDWQTALVPVFLYEIYQHIGMTHPRVCYTIHNYKHQGITGDFLLEASGLNRPDYYFHQDRLQDNHIPHAINLMKGGVVYSNFVTTVSPKYAGETKDGGQGFGLEPTLHTHHYKYGGIVNGIDYSAWNPEIDEHIPSHYTVFTIEEKYHNKHALRNRLLLADNEKPVVAFIGRLDPQKGLDLVRHALFYALNNGAQFVLLGSSPESDINNYFWELKHHLNDSPDCHIEVGFDEDLAHLIYAGADMIIVPSLFEPCGLTQLIAMQYGTIPVVRAVGGLADTVHDKDNAHDKPLHERNGFVFDNYDNSGLESALSRAISCYYEYPEHFRDLMKNAMNCDYSWKNAGQHYLNIYDYIRSK